MTTEFQVELKDLDASSVPEELVLTASGGKLEIGACRGNSNRRANLACLVQEKHGEWPAGTFYDRIYATIKELSSSRKPYYSKWSRDSPIEFFDTDLRFCFQIPVLLQSEGESNSEEDFCRGMLDFWDSILREDTPIRHSSHYPIDNWGDLREAIFSDKRYMEPSRFVQGTCQKYSVDLG